MYWRAPRLALVATWVIQSLQNKYVYIYPNQIRPVAVVAVIFFKMAAVSIITVSYIAYYWR